MKYIKLYEQHDQGITFKEWLENNPQDINTTHINCNYSYLIDLEGIQHFKKLNFLYCNDNKLISLPELPNSLKRLECSNNNLTTLPELSDSLKELFCNDNKLKSLPELPDSLKTLFCNDNKLTSLPELPDSLNWLNCSYNNLTILPDLPDSLKRLSCYNNFLSYTDLDEYKEWHKKTYPYIYKAKNYNI